MLKSVAVWCICAVSTAFRFLFGRLCRFNPSCSVYSAQSFRQHSFFKALRLSVGRLLRCHPFGGI